MANRRPCSLGLHNMLDICYDVSCKLIITAENNQAVSRRKAVNEVFDRFLQSDIILNVEDLTAPSVCFVSSA